MASAEVIQRIRSPRVVVGTPKEIAEHLKCLDVDKRLTLIIPGSLIPDHDEANEEIQHPTGKTFQHIFDTPQEGFDQSGMSEDELSDFIEAEVKAYRIERNAKNVNRD